MRKYIGIFIAFVCLPQISKSQTTLDSLQVSQLENVELISEIYSIPHTRYIMDHLLFARKSDQVDPEVQYNKGEKISEESKLFLKSLKPGDTLIIKNVYAVNRKTPEKGLVKLPEKMFLIK